MEYECKYDTESMYLSLALPAKAAGTAPAIRDIMMMQTMITEIAFGRKYSKRHI